MRRLGRWQGSWQDSLEFIQIRDMLTKETFLLVCTEGDSDYILIRGEDEPCRIQRASARKAIREWMESINSKEVL